MPVGHHCEVVSVGDETQGSKHGPLRYTACDWKICCGVSGMDERLSPVTCLQCFDAVGWAAGKASSL